MNVFEEVIKEAKEIYEKNEVEKGNSWETMPVFMLDEKLTEEYKEQLNAVSLKNKYAELLDLINVAMMLAERLRRKM
jgi:hypothetical protein